MNETRLARVIHEIMHGKTLRRAHLRIGNDTGSGRGRGTWVWARGDGRVGDGGGFCGSTFTFRECKHTHMSMGNKQRSAWLASNRPWVAAAVMCLSKRARPRRGTGLRPRDLPTSCPPLGQQTALPKAAQSAAQCAGAKPRGAQDADPSRTTIVRWGAWEGRKKGACWCLIR